MNRILHLKPGSQVPEWVEAIDRACFVEAWGPLDECEHIWAYPPHAFARWRIIPEVQEAELLRIGVAVEARRKGYGRALLRHSQAAMARLGVDVLHLEVRVSNLAARALYRKRRLGLPGGAQVLLPGRGDRGAVLLPGLIRAGIHLFAHAQVRRLHPLERGLLVRAL